jgi:GT2 family glycosyltransferase
MSMISVVILNYRRREELRRAVESAQAQNYEPKEVIVIDNASGDGTAEFVAATFPDVRIVALEENAGCAGRNHGVNAARGDIVVTIDNDVCFDTDFELGKIAAAFEKASEVSCVVFKVLRADNGRLHIRDWCHPRDYRQFADEAFETCFIPEGASAFRREEFLARGGYWERLWIGCEGWDLALRMLDAGASIWYRPEIRVRHSMSEETRGTGRNFYFYTRNYILIAARDYYGWRRVSYLAYHLAMMLWHSWRSNALGKFAAGLRDGVHAAMATPRCPISRATFRRLDRIARHRPGMIARFRRHWEKPLI